MRHIRHPIPIVGLLFMFMFALPTLPARAQGPVPTREAAARMTNQCRAVGISGSPADFLICAVAAELGWPVFTRDDDFARYAKTVPVKLYKARQPS